MFDSTEGLPGPVMRNRFGKPAVVNPRYVCGPFAHLSFSAASSRPVMSTAVIAPVTASKPVAKTIASKVNDFVGGVDAGFCDLSDRMLSDVDKAHVRQVVGGVIVRVQARPLRRDGIIRRAQIGRRLRIVDDGADLVPEELGELVIGCRVAQHIGVDVDRLEQLADLPGALIALLRVRPPRR